MTRLYIFYGISRNTGCVAQAYTSIAPSSNKASAPFMRVPPVSIMSSITIQVFPFTSPTIYITSDSFGAGLLLSIIAIGRCNLDANALALATPPTSGETTTEFSRFRLFFTYSASIGLAWRGSTGISKKP